MGKIHLLWTIAAIVSLTTQHFRVLVFAGDQAYVQTYDNLGDMNTWVTVKNEFYRAFTLQACSDVYISAVEGSILTFYEIHLEAIRFIN